MNCFYKFNKFWRYYRLFPSFVHGNGVFGGQVGFLAGLSTELAFLVPPVDVIWKRLVYSHLRKVAGDLSPQRLLINT